MKQTMLKVLNEFKNKKILVIGDIMLDKYIWGEVSRISPEAPVQVVNVIKESYAPGGAANVANNIAALNANVFMAGIVGNDEASKTLKNELEKRKINTEGIFIDKHKPTIQKVRIIGKNQQLLRVDYEIKEYVDNNIEEKIFNFVLKVINDIDAVVISDYAKGVITSNLANKIMQLFKKNNKIIVIDPKSKHKQYYQNATLITPNTAEAVEMAGIEEENDSDIVKIGNKLLNDLKCSVLITRGEKGMSLFEMNKEITHIPTKAKEVYDVTGAGDSVVGTITLALASNATLKESAILANHAAGIKVGKIGTATVSIEELKESIEDE